MGRNQVSDTWERGSPYEQYVGRWSRRVASPIVDGCSPSAVVAIGARSLLATMDWVFYRGDETLLKRWRQSYNLVRMDGRWKIVLSTFHVA